MLTRDELERRQNRIENGLEHRGTCEQVFANTGEVHGQYGRLLKCQTCGVKVCFGCRVYHMQQHSAEATNAKA